MGLLIGLFLGTIMLFLVSSLALPFILGAIATIFFTLVVLGTAAAVMALTVIGFSRYMSDNTDLTIRTQSAQHRQPPFQRQTQQATTSQSKDELIDELKSQFKDGDISLSEYERLLDQVLENQQSESTRTHSYETQRR